MFDPADPGSASNPDTSTAFASGISGNLVDLTVDPAGNLYYLTQAPARSRRFRSRHPAIATQPVGQKVNAGPDGDVHGRGERLGPLSYQWQHLVGATWVNVGTNSPAYTIAAATTADAGSYRVIVSNSAGSVVSDAVVLAVNPARRGDPGPGTEGRVLRLHDPAQGMPNLAGRVADVTRTDAVIDYVPTRHPWAGLDARFANTFAVRETGYLEVATAGRYTLSLRSKDGSKLWLDGSPAHQQRRNPSPARGPKPSP